MFLIFTVTSKHPRKYQVINLKEAPFSIVCFLRWRDWWGICWTNIGSTSNEWLNLRCDWWRSRLDFGTKGGESLASWRVWGGCCCAVWLRSLYDWEGGQDGSEEGGWVKEGFVTDFTIINLQVWLHYVQCDGFSCSGVLLIFWCGQSCRAASGGSSHS